MRKHVAIAIDGPSGSGKSTLARALAEHFGYTYIDTGALYRAIGLSLIRNDVASDDVPSIVSHLNRISVTLGFSDGKSVPLLNGEDVSAFIRNPQVSKYASDCSKIPEVRAFLLSLQKEIAATADVVMDGRDIGTVIIPDAQVKLFLTADNSERAVRRYGELRDKGADVSLEDIKRQMCERDRNDSTRDIAPAVPADDAIMLDNSALSKEETLAHALEIISKRLCR